jgi:hypothetical protein
MDEIIESSERVVIGKLIMGSNWCTYCWPVKEYALFINNGESVCEKHFKPKQ